MVGAGFTGKPDKDYEIPDLVDFTRDFMTAVGVERASLVGVSLGAWTAARFAFTYPEMADRIILTSPVGLKRLHPQAVGNSEEAMQKRTEIVRDTSWEKTRTIFKGMILRDEDIIPDFVKIRQAMHRLPNAEHDMRHVLAIGKTEVYERGAMTDDDLRSIKCPALIFMSEHDVPFFKLAAQGMAELIPNATLIPLSDAAHWAQFERADYFNAVTVAFLKGEPLPKGA